MLEAASIDHVKQFDAHLLMLSDPKATIERTVDESALVHRIMLLDGAYTYFEDLLKYHRKMDLNAQAIDKMVLDIDDMIDLFEEYEEKRSSSELLDAYYQKAARFHDLLIRTQVALGFFKVER